MYIMYKGTSRFLLIHNRENIIPKLKKKNAPSRRRSMKEFSYSQLRSFITIPVIILG